MIGTSPEFQAAVKTNHHAIAKVDVVKRGAVVGTLAVHSGEVSADRTAAQLRRFVAQVADPTGALTPAGVRDLLAPFGTQLRVYRGVRVTQITQATRNDQTQADWAAGTLTYLVATVGNTLELG